MLEIIRLILLGLSIAFCMIMGSVFAIFSPFNPINMFYMALVWGNISRGILGITFKKVNFKELDDGKPCVYVMNHQSNFDIVIAAQIMLKNTVTLGKKEILYFPFFGIWYWLSGNILIKRENRQAVIRSMMRVNKTITKKKRSILIMPEGTRSKGKGLGEFKEGAFRTAIATGVPIVPIMSSSWHQNIKLNELSSGTLTIKIGKSFSTEGMTSKDAGELSKNVRDYMKEELSLI